jgi:hypothetical protein
MVVLLSAWTSDLKAGTFVTASPTGAPVFGQEIYPISCRHVAEIRDVVEQPFTTPVCLELFETNHCAPDLLLLPLDETTPRVLRSTDFCYRLMSMQW